MNDVEFDKDSVVHYVNIPRDEYSYLTKTLIKISFGLIKTKEQANILMFFLAIIFFILSFIVIF